VEGGASAFLGCAPRQIPCEWLNLYRFWAPNCPQWRVSYRLTLQPGRRCGWVMWWRRLGREVGTLRPGSSLESAASGREGHAGCIRRSRVGVKVTQGASGVSKWSPAPDLPGSRRHASLPSRPCAIFHLHSFRVSRRSSGPTYEAANTCLPGIASSRQATTLEFEERPASPKARSAGPQGTSAHGPGLPVVRIATTPSPTKESPWPNARFPSRG